jgi:ribose transport system substrate-binding protein
MNRPSSLASRVVAILAIAFAASCSKSPDAAKTGPAPPTKGKIGMTCMDLTNPYFKYIADVMQEEAAKYGYDLVAQNGGNDGAAQNSQLSDFVAQRYDAIFLNPADSQAAGQGVKKAEAAGIPVFTFDVEVTDAEAKEIVKYHIGSNNYQGGQLAAESMMQVTGDQGKIAVITFPEITSCIDRRNGFMDYLKEKQSKLEVVTELSGQGKRENGYTVATDILQSHPDIVGIFAVNDPSALGAFAAVKKAEREKNIHVIGFDASPAGKQAVFEKQLYDSPQQFPRKMAVDTVAAFVKYLEGRPLLKREFIPCKHYRYEDSVNDESRIAEQW